MVIILGSGVSFDLMAWYGRVLTLVTLFVGTLVARFEFR